MLLGLLHLQNALSMAAGYLMEWCTAATIAAGADVNWQDPWGRVSAPVCECAYALNLRIEYISHALVLLIMQTALMLASDKNGLAVMQQLLKAGASLDLVDQDNWTALYRACDKGRSEAAVLLLEAGASANLTDKKGKVR